MSQPMLACIREKKAVATHNGHHISPFRKTRKSIGVNIYSDIVAVAGMCVCHCVVMISAPRAREPIADVASMSPLYTYI